jgi:hypothetical protein
MAHLSAALEMASAKLVAESTLIGRIGGQRVLQILTDQMQWIYGDVASLAMK